MSEEDLIIAKGREVAVNIMGMTLRDYFAGQVLASLAAPTLGSATKAGAVPPVSRVSAVVAEWSYAMADAMLEERDK